MSVTRKWKLQWWSGLKNSQQDFTRQGYMLSFEGKTLLFRETMTMLGSKNVIYRRPASFSCMIDVPVLVIIPVLKKKDIIFWLRLVYSNILLKMFDDINDIFNSFTLIKKSSSHTSSTCIALGRSSKRHPVPAQSFLVKYRGRPVLECQYVGIF